MHRKIAAGPGLAPNRGLLVPTPKPRYLLAAPLSALSRWVRRIRTPTAECVPSRPEGIRGRPKRAECVLPAGPHRRRLVRPEAWLLPYSPARRRARDATPPPRRPWGIYSRVRCVRRRESLPPDDFEAHTKRNTYKARRHSRNKSNPN